ncbi:MAG: MDR family MFS transporter [Propionibacteriaceae bacterium]
MTRREVLQALSGLLLGMFVSILAGTVVSTSLPVIVADLGGGNTSYTWVITATLLATTVSTPIWGKLADLTNRKLLIQIALTLFVVSSAIAGFSQGPEMLITMRVFQGLGAGGLTALSQIILADIISPRERGKYMGLFGGVMALGTVSGPLLGGVITDTINWRWNFYVAVPFAIIAVILLQKTLHLPALQRRKVSIDYPGIVLLASGVSLLLIWVSLAGNTFDWAGTQSYLMVAGSVILLALFVIVEFRAGEPLIPLHLFRNRTFTLAVVGSVSIGVAMFGTSVFLAQYMQLARGANATQSGLMTIPMMLGMFVVSTLVGQLISRTGKWKRYVVTGAVLLTIGLTLLSTIEYDTNFALVSVYMFLLGAGVGMTMQNMVLLVQNSVAVQDLGVATSGVSFFRSLGGTAGISALGAVLGSAVSTGITDRAADLKAAIASLPPEQAKAVMEELASGAIPVVRDLPEPVRVIIESVYGQSVASVFAMAIPLGLLTLLAMVFLPKQELSRQTAQQKRVELDLPDPESRQQAEELQNAELSEAELERALIEAEQDLMQNAEAVIAATPRELSTEPHDGSADPR